MPEQRVAIVTGAAQGIGAAIAEELASEGHLVVVTDINETGAKAVADRIGGVAKTLDVSSQEEVNRVIGEVASEMGRTTILESGTTNRICMGNMARSTHPYRTQLSSASYRWCRDDVRILHSDGCTRTLACP